VITTQFNCREECSYECPPVTCGTRCRLYREQLQRRAAQLGHEAGVDVPFRLQKLGVPADNILALRKATDTKALEGAKRFLTAPKDLVRFLVLVGPHGAGKSTAAAYVLAEAVRRHDWNSQASGGRQTEPFVWTNAAEVTSVVDFGRVAPEWVEGLKRASLLVLDDLGKDGTEVGLAALRDVLTYRHEKQRRTVVTSNLAPSDFKARYGESWYERLKSAAMVPDLRNEKSMRKRPEWRP
jgi:DNA replication protein DnaC